VHKPDWPGYLCPLSTIDHQMLIVESMDYDNMDRRVSPVALRADGYLDLVNGPKDSGTCGGYTCRKRMQTFYTLVAAGLCLTSTINFVHIFVT